MLSTQKVFTQWENGNSLRKFPFTESSSLIDIIGLVLPDNIISDIILFYPNTEHTPVLSCVKLTKESISVAFGLNGALLTSCIVMRESFTPYVPVPMTATLPGSSGYITFGNIVWPETPILYRFSNMATVDSRACIMVPQPGVTSFVDDVSGEELSGIVEINIPQYVTASIENINHVFHVKFDLDEYGRAALSTECHAGSDEEACGVPVIRSICGVKPNSAGEILLRFA